MDNEMINGLTNGDQARNMEVVDPGAMLVSSLARFHCMMNRMMNRIMNQYRNHYKKSSPGLDSETQID